MKGFIIHRINAILGHFPRLHRAVRYRNPQDYWVKRGGEQYFHEQESVEERHLRSSFMMERFHKLSYGSVLEVGCGYGKQLRNLKNGSDCRVVGMDWSHTQLGKAKEFIKDLKPLRLVEADATKLPFQDKSFDLVLTSAVILHNREPQAKAIVHEILRVAKKYIAHNEDTDITWTRFGYDMCKTYQALGQKIVESGPFPLGHAVRNTQFTIIELDTSKPMPSSAENIPLQYFHVE